MHRKPLLDYKLYSSSLNSSMDNLTQPLNSLCASFRNTIDIYIYIYFFFFWESLSTITLSKFWARSLIKWTQTQISLSLSLSYRPKPRLVPTTSWEAFRSPMADSLETDTYGMLDFTLDYDWVVTCFKRILSFLETSWVLGFQLPYVVYWYSKMGCSWLEKTELAK